MFCTHYGIPCWPTRKTLECVLLILTLAAVFILLSSTSGCQGKTPARVAFITVEAANDTLEAIPLAYRTGLMTREEVAYVQPYAIAVGTAANSLDQAILDGKVDLGAYKDALTKAVTELLNKKAEAKRLLKPAATHPN